jgi:hypothetical protein
MRIITSRVVLRVVSNLWQPVRLRTPWKVRVFFGLEQSRWLAVVRNGLSKATKSYSSWISMDELPLEFYLSMIAFACWQKAPVPTTENLAAEWTNKHVQIYLADPWNRMVEITFSINSWLQIWNCASWLMQVGPEKSSTHDSYLFRPRKVGNSCPGYGRPRPFETKHLT